MKLTTNRRDLHDGLQIAARVVGTRSSLAVLANVLLDATGDTLRLAATDLEIGVERLVPATIEAAGLLTVSAKALTDIIAVLPEAPVTVTHDAAKGELTLVSEKSRYRLKSLLDEVFPVLPEVGADTRITLSETLLREMLRSVLFAVCTDDTRPALAGVCVELRDGTLTMTATDTHQLAKRRERPTDASGADLRQIVPARGLNELVRVLDGSSDDPVTIRFDDKQVLFEAKAMRLTSRLIASPFPNCDKVIPTSHTHRFTADTNELRQAVRRAAVVGTHANNRLFLELTKAGRLLITVEAGDLGSAHEEIEVVSESDPIRLALDSRFLLGVLGAVEGETVAVEMTQPLRPVVMRPVDGADWLALVMPMNPA